MYVKKMISHLSLALVLASVSVAATAYTAQAAVWAAIVDSAQQGHIRTAPAVTARISRPMFCART